MSLHDTIIGTDCIRKEYERFAVIAIQMSRVLDHYFSTKKSSRDIFFYTRLQSLKNILFRTSDGIRVLQDIEEVPEAMVMVADILSDMVTLEFYERGDYIDEEVHDVGEVNPGLDPDCLYSLVQVMEAYTQSHVA